MKNNKKPLQINKYKQLYIALLICTIVFCTFSKNTLSFETPDRTIDLDPNITTKKTNKVTIDQIDQSNLANVSILRGLNKITAKTEEFEVEIGNEVQFGRLSIIAHQCWQSPPDQTPESKVLLEIYETGSNNIRNQIFHGWMFASSPSISGLEHPIYDITALNCLFR